MELLMQSQYISSWLVVWSILHERYEERTIVLASRHNHVSIQFLEGKHLTLPYYKRWLLIAAKKTYFKYPTRCFDESWLPNKTWTVRDAKRTANFSGQGYTSFTILYWMCLKKRFSAIGSEKSFGLLMCLIWNLSSLSSVILLLRWSSQNQEIGLLNLETGAWIPTERSIQIIVDQLANSKVFSFIQLKLFAHLIKHCLNGVLRLHSNLHYCLATEYLNGKQNWSAVCVHFFFLVYD